MLLLPPDNSGQALTPKGNFINLASIKSVLLLQRCKSYGLDCPLARNLPACVASCLESLNQQGAHPTYLP